MAGTKIKHKSGVADGATAIGHEFDTKTSLVTAGAKILSVKNAGTEKFSVDKDGNSSQQFERTVRPDEGAAGINSAISALNALGGGKVKLLAGTYNINVSVGAFTITNFNNIEIEGVGEGTILDINSGAGLTGGTAMAVGGTAPILSTPINDITVGDTSIFTTTVATAGNVLAGDFIRLSGYDVDGVYDEEWHEASANGNAGTGEIPLHGKILRTMNDGSGTLVASASRNGRNNSVKNVRFTHSSGVAVGFLTSDNSFRNLFENITCDTFIAADSALSMTGIYNTMRGCKIRNVLTTGTAITMQSDLFGLCENNMIDTVANTTFSLGINGSVDFICRGNKIYNSAGSGICNIYGSGAVNRRCSIYDNLVSKTGVYGIAMGGGVAFTAEINIHNNSIDGCLSGAGIEIPGGRRYSIIGNHVYNCSQGIRTQGGKDSVIMGNTLQKISPNDGISLQLSASVGLVIKGNMIKNVPSSNAISVSEVSKCVIEGNMIDTANVGISCSGVSCTDNVINGNVILNITAASSGILQTNDVTNSTIVGNNARGEGITLGTGAGHLSGLNQE